MWVWTHLRAMTWSLRPKLPGISWSPELKKPAINRLNLLFVKSLIFNFTEWSQAIVDCDKYNILVHQKFRPVFLDAAVASVKAAAMDPKYNRQQVIVFFTLINYVIFWQIETFS
jgi:hypothetical protein